MQSLTDFLASQGAWNWILAGGVLIILETVFPGLYLLWFGLAAVATGALALGLDMAWAWQLIVFAALAVAAVFLVRRFTTESVTGSEEPDLNSRGAQYVGRIVTVEDAFQGGRGKVRVGDTLWPASGPDLPKGARVTVTGCVGTVLKVEAA
jgi:inner membrane protein